MPRISSTALTSRVALPAHYGNGSDEAFLRRLWHDLYGDQPCSGGLPHPAPADHADPGTSGAGSSPHRALDAAYYEDLAGRLYGLLIGLEDWLDRQDARQSHHFIEVGEYSVALEEIAGALAQATVPITDQELSDMLAPTRTTDMDELVPAHWSSARVPDSRTDVRMDGELRWTAQEQRPALAGIQAHRADTTAARARFPARVASRGSGDSGTRRGALLGLGADDDCRIHREP